MIKKILTFFLLVIHSAEVSGQKRVEFSANEIITTFSETIKELSGYRVDITTQTQIEQGDIDHVFRSKYTLTLQRPNRIAITNRSGRQEPTVISNGEKLYVYLPLRNEYLEKKAPARLGSLFEPGNEAGGVLQEIMPLIRLFAGDNPEEFIQAKLSQIEYVGKEEIDGILCHHLKLPQNGADLGIYVEANDKFLLRRLDVDIKQESVNVKMEWNFDNWQSEPVMDSDFFEFKPPTGAREVLFFAQDKPHPMVGQKAADFKMDLLNGGEVELRRQLKKDVVVLDFWAIRCAPCRLSLPEMSKVAQDYSDKGVVIYAVNAEDNAARIRRYLDEVELTLNVALDTTYSVSRQYEVRSIPHAIVIGRNGIIQSVHMGYGPQTVQRFRVELDALLAGKDLAAMATNQHEFGGSIDLSSPEVKFIPNPIKVGFPVSVSCVIRNAGSADVPAGMYTIGLLWDGKNVFYGPGTVSVPAGGEAVFAIEPDTWQLTINKAGSYEYILVIDPDGKVPESDEKNNVTRGTITVEEVGKESGQ